MTAGTYKNPITDAQRRQYQEEGYFILERAIPKNQLQIVENACDHLIDLMHQEMDALGTDHIHISHRGKRYHISKKYDQAPHLDEFVFGDLMAEICRSTIGNNAYLFYDQYVVKAAEKGIKFSWHQDSGYLGFSHRPYVTCWCAVDDMTLANGTAFVLPYSSIGIRSLVEHVRDPETGDMVGYFGKEEGVAAVVPAGSVVVFSSLAFHRSGANSTNKMRRAYVTQYSPDVILDPRTGAPKHLAVPFLKNGNVVYERTTAAVA
jgi:ectoine hydroxylase-related dioxygenase (phytanoyl-CoA dioxygenase family)